MPKPSSLSDAIWQGIQEQTADAAIVAIDTLGYGVNLLASELTYALGGNTDDFSQEMERRQRTAEPPSSSNRRTKSRSKSKRRGGGTSNRKHSVSPSKYDRKLSKSKHFKNPSVALYRNEEREESETSSRVRVKNLIEKFDGAPPDEASASYRKPRTATNHPRARDVAHTTTRQEFNLDQAIGITEMEDSRIGSMADDLASVLDEQYSSSGIFRPRPDSFNEDSERFGYLRVRGHGSPQGKQASVPISPLTPFQDLHEVNKRALIDDSGATFDTRSISQVKLPDLAQKSSPKGPDTRKMSTKLPSNDQMDKEINAILFSEAPTKPIMRSPVPERGMSTRRKKGQPFRSYSPPPPMPAENRTNTETLRSNSNLEDQRDVNEASKEASITDEIEQVQRLILELQEKNKYLWDKKEAASAAAHAENVPASVKRQQERERMQQIRELVQRLGRLSARHKELKAKGIGNKQTSRSISFPPPRRSRQNPQARTAAAAEMRRQLPKSVKPAHDALPDLVKIKENDVHNDNVPDERHTKPASRSTVGSKKGDDIDLSDIIDLSSYDDHEFDAQLSAVVA